MKTHCYHTSSIPFCGRCEECHHLGIRNVNHPGYTPIPPVQFAALLELQSVRDEVLNGERLDEFRFGETGIGTWYKRRGPSALRHCVESTVDMFAEHLGVQAWLLDTNVLPLEAWAYEMLKPYFD